MKKTITAGYMFIALLSTVNVLASQTDEEYAEELSLKQRSTMQERLKKAIMESYKKIAGSNPTILTDTFKTLNPLFSKHKMFKGWNELTQLQAIIIVTNIMLSLNYDEKSLDQKKLESKETYESPQEIIDLLTPENISTLKILNDWMFDKDLFDVFQKIRKTEEDREIEALLTDYVQIESPTIPQQES